ncbi:MAG TPA: M36 family metallopeptidase [Rhodanobacteraceae bacterium]|nr:M36 family metallopeptidase [Rhodanobacteraceae bacterium]
MFHFGNTRFVSFARRARRPALGACVLAAALPLCSLAAPAKPAELDALARAPVAAASRHALASATSGYRVQAATRLGIPSFLSSVPGQQNRAGASLLISKDPSAVARSYLKSLATAYRIDAAEVDALPILESRRLSNGAALVRFGHRVQGIEVFRESATVLVNADGGLNSIGGYVSGAGETARQPLSALFLQPATEAIAAALADFHFAAAATRTQLQLQGDQGDYDYYTLDAATSDGVRLAQPVRVKQVFFRTPSGLVPAYYMEVHTADSEDRSDYAYVVSAKDGTVLYRHNLVAYDAYSFRVWAEAAAPHQPYPGPTGRGGIPHPTGNPDGYQPPLIAANLITLTNAMPASSVAAADPWLPANATETTGNNVDAYADLTTPTGYNNGDLRPTTSADHAFDYSYDASLTPQANSNQISATTAALFYLTNWLHDWYYDDGFDEAAGNAQEDNYGRGGVDGDRMLAETANNPSRNNANMMTPADGGDPRMQMFVFDGASSNAVTVQPGNASYASNTAAFGPTQFNLSDSVVQATDTGGVSSTDGCEAIGGVSGSIALVDRGTCSFKTKALNAQNAGATGMLLVNNVAGAAPGLGDDTTITTAITIPVLSLSQADGNTVKAALAGGAVTAQMQRTSVVDRDSSLDAGIVAHEWGHYISGRLVHNGNGLSSNMSGGMGEGFGDFHALLLLVKAEDAQVAANSLFDGVYSTSGYILGGQVMPGFANNSYYNGIRRYPYSSNLAKNPLTFKHIQTGVALPSNPPPAFGGDNAEVHNTGEVWASMLWQCYSSILRDTLGTSPRLDFATARDRMKRYMVNGYKLMPVAPTFTEARDSILQAIAAQDLDDYAACASGFAERGIGAGAVSPDRYSTTNSGVVESYSATGSTANWLGASVTEAAGSCDMDGSLDGGETGTLSLTLHNNGFGTMSATSVSVSSPQGLGHLPQAALPVPAIAPFASATIEVPVTLDALSGMQSFIVNYSAADPALAAALPGQTTFQVNVDQVPAASDDFENPVLAWTSQLQGLSDPENQWRRVSLGATGHGAFGPDSGAPGLSMLVSPPLHVSATGNFVLTFQQKYGFEKSNANYDGGVIEVSTNGGSTWQDVTSVGSLTPAYGGALFEGSDNPYANRNAYVGNSGTSMTAASIDFGTALQGQTVLVRFVVATDAAQGDQGWTIDNVVASGIDGMPFTNQAADDGQCSVDVIFANDFEIH